MKRALGWLLLVYACLFELALALFLLGVGIMAWVSNPEGLKTGIIPWEGITQVKAALILGVLGVAAVLLVGSRLRWIFPLWCLLVLGLLVRGFFLTNYYFQDAGQFRTAAWLTAGAVAAFLGSIGVFRSRARVR